MAFNQQGSLSSNPTLALNTNQNKNAGLFQQPPKSNILSGYTPPQTQTVSNPLQGGGMSSTIQVPKPPADTSTPMPAGWTSGLGIPSSLGGTQNQGTPNTFSGLLHPSLTPATPVKSITDGSGNKVDFHAPKVVAPDDPANMYNTATGAKNPNYKDPNTPTPPVNVPPPTGQAPMVGNTTGNQTQNVSNAGAQTPQENQTYTGLVNQSQTESPQVAQARQALVEAQKQFAQQTSDINQSGTWTSRALGEQGQANIQNASVLNALQGGVQNALTSQGQQITAGTAANQAAQTTAQRGLGAQESVLGAVQPQPYGITTTPYQPATGTFGTMAGNTAGTGGLQNIGNVQGQIGVGQNVAQLNSYLGGAQVVGNNLNDLITQNNINPTGLTYANGALQFGASAMSNPAYQKFAGQINDFVASLAPILGVGGASTDMKTQMSSQIVNALQSGSTIKDVVSYFLDQAQQKIKGLSAGGGAGVGSTQGGGQGSSVSAGGYNFTQDAQGNWIPQ